MKKYIYLFLFGVIAIALVSNISFDKSTVGAVTLTTEQKK
jgi:hypothetical protein